MIKVLVVDNHPVIRSGLKLLFEYDSDIKVVGSVSSGIEIFEFLKDNAVDIIISEIDLPKLNGITALRAIKKEHPQVKVVMFSHHPEEIYAISTIKAGASGYVSKSSDTETIKKALLKIHYGQVYLSENMAVHYNRDKSRKNSTKQYKRLSTREVEVLKLLSSGKRNKEIAIELAIDEKTVSTYKARLLKKLNVTNLIDLVHQGKHMELT